MREHPATFVFGIVFVLFGIGYLLDLSGVWEIRPIRLWPVVLIAIGAVIALTARRPDDEA